MPSGFKGAGSPWFGLEERDVLKHIMEHHIRFTILSQQSYTWNRSVRPGVPAELLHRPWITASGNKLSRIRGRYYRWEGDSGEHVLNPHKNPSSAHHVCTRGTRSVTVGGFSVRDVAVFSKFGRGKSGSCVY